MTVEEYSYLISGILVGAILATVLLYATGKC